MIRFSFLLTVVVIWLSGFTSFAQAKIDSLLPVRGFCIAAPQPRQLDTFIKFINEELAPRQVNTLILRVDFNYEFDRHPELRDSVALSKRDVKKLVKACQKNNIRLIPQINLLGHQSWASKTTNLLRVYPEFDETPTRENARQICVAKSRWLILQKLLPTASGRAQSCFWASRWNLRCVWNRCVSCGYGWSILHRRR